MNKEVDCVNYILNHNLIVGSTPISVNFEDSQYVGSAFIFGGLDFQQVRLGWSFTLSTYTKHMGELRHSGLQTFSSY